MRAWLKARTDDGSKAWFTSQKEQRREPGKAGGGKQKRKDFNC